MGSYQATCHTSGCGNQDATITMSFNDAYPPNMVQCGVCGQQITDTSGLPAT